MTSDTMDAAERLAGVLLRENAALAALDLRKAGAMLGEKLAASAAFARAEAAGKTPTADLARRLGTLAQENRVRLEHAMIVQRRIIGLIARAMRDTVPAPRYGASGAVAAGRSMPFALSARA